MLSPGGKNQLGAQLAAAVISNFDECLFYGPFVQLVAQLHFLPGPQARERLALSLGAHDFSKGSI